MEAKEWKQSAVEMAIAGMSWRSISKELDVPRSTVGDFLRKHFSEEYQEKVAKKAKPVVRKYSTEEDNSRILLISDMHIPYHHKDTLKFLQHLKDKYKPTRIICLGDEVDGHSLSFHDHDPDLASAGDELRQAIPVIKEVEKMFPKMDLLESNHGSLIWRKAKTNGIPKHYIKTYNEVLGVTDWKWHFDLTVKLPNGQHCYFHHGKVSKTVQLSQQMGMNAVQGHYHNNFSIEYWGNPVGLFWGLQIGCLIDDNALAFSYNNVNVKRPVLGTGLIIDSIPILEPMILSENGDWIGPSGQV